MNLVRVEVGRRTRPSAHCSVLQLVERRPFARPQISTETHGAFRINSQLRSFRGRRTTTRSLLHSQLLLQVVLVQGRGILWSAKLSCTLGRSNTLERA